MEGWKRIPLAAIADVFTDGDWIESKDQSLSGVRLIQTGNIGEGEFKDRRDKARFIDGATFKRLNCTEVLPGDCLISRLPDPVGRSCIVPDTPEKMITAVDCTIVRFKSEMLITDFFRYYSLSDGYLNSVSRVCTGATRKRISRKNLGKIEIPLPPLPEQRRIVAILDEVFEGIDRAIANTEQNLANARELFESYLNRVFTEKGEGWVEKRFGDVCEFVRGPFGGSLKKSSFVDAGYAVYEQRHAIRDNFHDVRYFVDSDKFAEMARFELRPDDLIMSCSGTMGKVAIAPDDLSPGIINQALLKLTPSKMLRAEFLRHWMESDNFQQQLSKHSKGAAIKNVASVKVLKEIDVPVPAISDQSEVVERIDVQQGLTHNLQSHYTRKLAALAELKQSILRKAFSGELTSQTCQV